MTTHYATADRESADFAHSAADNEHTPLLDPLDDDLTSDEKDELGQLLRESMEEAKQTFSLDDLLDESMADVRRENEVKEARRRMASGNLDYSESKETQQLIREWEAARVWNKIANTITFTNVICERCGQYHPTFTAYGEDQQHKTENITRWVKVDEHTADLPKQVYYQDEYVPICENCAIEDGWETRTLDEQEEQPAEDDITDHVEPATDDLADADNREQLPSTEESNEL